MLRPLIGPGELIDRSYSVPVILSSEYRFFSDLRPRDDHPSPDTLNQVVVERTSGKRDEELMRDLGKIAGMKELLLQEGDNLGQDLKGTMTYQRSLDPARLLRSESVVVGRSNGSECEIGVGWRLSAPFFNHFKAGSTYGWSYTRGSEKAEAFVALTLHSWLEEEGPGTVEGRLYVDRDTQPLSTPIRQLSAAEIPEDAQKDFIQLFHDTAWDSLGARR